MAGRYYAGCDALMAGVLRFDDAAVRPCGIAAGWEARGIIATPEIRITRGILARG